VPRSCADKQRITGLTAVPVPTTNGGSSDPMILKAVIRTDHFVTGKVMSSAAAAHDGGRAVMVGLRTETDPA